MVEVDFSWSTLAPIIALTLASLAVLLADLFLGPKTNRKVLGWIGLVGVAITAEAACSLSGAPGSTLAGAVIVDDFGLFFALLFCLATGLTLLMSMSYLEQTEIQTGDYYSLLMFASLGMLIMALAGDLLVLFLGLEVMSVAAYALAGMQRSRPQSNEAALKYFLLGAFATGFLLFGIALVFGATGSTNLAVIGDAVAVRRLASEPLLIAGVGLLLVGFSFKVAVAPFHVWTPDVYEGAPTSVTAFMAVGVKAAAFAAFARIFLDTFGGVAGSWNDLLWVLAVLTMTVGNVTAVVQTNLKRLLAYSSVAHAGYLLVGLIVGGEAGGAALLFYLFVYAVMTLGAFAVVIAVGRSGEPIQNLDDYAGIGFRSPFLGLAMTIFMLSLAGIPPLAGFVGKFYLFSAAVDAGYLWLAIIGVLNSAVSVYYYVAVIVRMYMVEGEPEVLPLGQRPHVALALLVMMVATIAIGLLPSSFFAFAETSFAGLA